LSGCEEKDTTQNDVIDIEKMILGSWKWVESIGTFYGNTTSFTDTENYSIHTFYENGTVKIEHIDKYAAFQEIEWQKYEIKNNKQIIFSRYVSFPPLIGNISISRDGKNLTITYEYNYKNFTSNTGKYIKLE
jgi:hypothetical protein